MQKIIDTTYSSALAAGCDCVQVKHDGMWTQFSIHDGECAMSTTFQRDPIARLGGFPLDMDCILIGTSMVTMKRHFIYDCWMNGGPDGENITLLNLKDTPYRTRYALARIQSHLAGEFFELVINHPISHAQELWKTLPNVPHAKGLVFRNSRDTVSSPLRVVRWYAERPGELV